MFGIHKATIVTSAAFSNQRLASKSAGSHGTKVGASSIVLICVDAELSAASRNWMASTVRYTLIAVKVGNLYKYSQKAARTARSIEPVFMMLFDSQCGSAR